MTFLEGGPGHLLSAGASWRNCLGGALGATPAISQQTHQATAEQRQRTRLGSCDGAEQTMVFDFVRPGNSRREIQGAGTCALSAISKSDAPETLVDKRHAVGAIQRPKLHSRDGVESVDGAVAEVPN